MKHCNFFPFHLMPAHCPHGYTKIPCSMCVDTHYAVPLIALYETEQDKNQTLRNDCKELLDALVEALKALDFAKTRDPDQAGLYHCPLARNVREKYIIVEDLPF